MGHVNMECRMSSHTFRKMLDPDWAEALLNVPSKIAEGSTVAQHLASLREQYQQALVEANDILDSHPFVDVIAAEAAKREGLSGDHTLVLGDDAQIYLGLKSARKVMPKVETKKPEPEADPGARKWSSKLPSISVLRQQAKELGIDPEPFGRSKKRLKAAIEERKAEAQPKGFHKRTGSPASATVLENIVLAADDVDLPA